MNKNNFKKYFILQMACLISCFGIVIYYLYQQPIPSLADRENILSSSLQEAGFDGVDLEYKNVSVDDDRSLDFHTLEKKFETGIVRIKIVEDRLAHSVFAIRRQVRTVVVENSVDKPDLPNAALFVKTVLEIGESAAPRKTNVVFSNSGDYPFANYKAE